MADQPQQEPEGQKTFLGLLLTLPFKILGILLGALLGAILLEWICLYLVWPEEGWRHARMTFEQELGWLSQDLLRSLIVQEPGRTATWLTHSVYEWLMVKTGLQDGLDTLTSHARRPHRDEGLDLRYLIGWVLIQTKDLGLSALYTTLTFCVRLVILVLTLPLFLMAAFTGLVDGLVRRDLRKFGAGRESSYLFHKARASLVPLMILPWTLYLAIPISLSPLLVLLPCAVLLGTAVCVTAATFKKYL